MFLHRASLSAVDLPQTGGVLVGGSGGPQCQQDVCGAFQNEPSVVNLNPELPEWMWGAECCRHPRTVESCGLLLVARNGHVEQC